MKKETKIISIDAETNGLWGNPFAIAAVVYDNEKQIDSIRLRLPDSVVTESWVKENVLPTLDFPVTHEKYEDMLKTFSDFYLKYKNHTALWHMGHVVEAFLFREMHRLGFIGDFEAPYCPIEVSGVLIGWGYQKPDSVDGYLEDHGLVIEGETHNPLYDCEVAAKVYFHSLREAENLCPPYKVGGTSWEAEAGRHAGECKDFTSPDYVNPPMHQQF